MDFLSTGLYAVVDLATGKISEERIDDDLLRETLGGVGMSLALYNKYEPRNPLVFGTGLLTGTLAPAACLGFATAKSPRTGRIVHVPYSLHNGVELKLSGFDFVVVLGEAKSPKYLWLHDGLIDLRDGAELWGTDVWQTVDFIRKTIGEDQIQVFAIGKAGEDQSALAQITINYWGSADRFGLGAVMGSKKLKAVAVRGLGSLEVDDCQGFLDDSVELLEGLKGASVAKERGLANLSSAFVGQGYGEWLAPLVHRHHACFNCPAACNTFLKYNESPAVLTYLALDEPGGLIVDFEAMLGLKRAGYALEEAARLLERCSRLGVDAVAVAYAASDGTPLASDARLEQLTAVASDYAPWPWEGPTAQTAAQSPFSTWSIPDETVGGRPLAPEKWLRNNSMGHMLGVCPLFLALAPEVDADQLLSLLNKGTGWDVTHQELEQAAERIAKA